MGICKSGRSRCGARERVQRCFIFVLKWHRLDFVRPLLHSYCEGEKGLFRTMGQQSSKGEKIRNW